MRKWFSERYWRRLYKEYMNSDEWAAIRQKVMDRARDRSLTQDPVCERCGRIRALQVHHLHYNTFRQETLDDLLAVCDVCHKKVDRERVQEGRKTHEEARVRGWMTSVYGSGWENDFTYRQGKQRWRRWLKRKDEK